MICLLVAICQVGTTSIWTSSHLCVCLSWKLCFLRPPLGCQPVATLLWFFCDLHFYSILSFDTYIWLWNIAKIKTFRYTLCQSKKMVYIKSLPGDFRWKSKAEDFFDNLNLDKCWFEKKICVKNWIGQNYLNPEIKSFGNLGFYISEKENIT